MGSSLDGGQLDDVFDASLACGNDEVSFNDELVLGDWTRQIDSAVITTERV